MDILIHNFKLFYGNTEERTIPLSHILKDKQLLKSLNWLACVPNRGTSGIRTKIISLWKPLLSKRYHMALVERQRGVIAGVLACLGSSLGKSINSNAVINNTMGTVPSIDNFHFHYCGNIIKEIQFVILLKLVFLPPLGSFKHIVNRWGSQLMLFRWILHFWFSATTYYLNICTKKKVILFLQSKSERCNITFLLLEGLTWLDSINRHNWNSYFFSWLHCCHFKSPAQEDFKFPYRKERRK